MEYRLVATLPRRKSEEQIQHNLFPEPGSFAMKSF